MARVLADAVFAVEAFAVAVLVAPPLTVAATGTTLLAVALFAVDRLAVPALETARVDTATLMTAGIASALCEVGPLDDALPADDGLGLTASAGAPAAGTTTSAAAQARAGSMRAERPHPGRPAVGDPLAEGAEFEWVDRAELSQLEAERRGSKARIPAR